jgi:hypothetical protein
VIDNDEPAAVMRTRAPGSKTIDPTGGRVKTMVRQIVKKVPVVGRSFAQRDELRAIRNQFWEPPGHFYSPIPDLTDIRRNEDRVFAAQSKDIRGVDLNESAQLTLLAELIPFYAEQPFTPHKQPGTRYFFENNTFSYCDAVLYYALLRLIRPRRVIEIGSGHSSCALLDTNERFFNHSVLCTFIEPYPQVLRSLLEAGDSRRMTLIDCNLQDVDPDVFGQLEANDILFIDRRQLRVLRSAAAAAGWRVHPLPRHLLSVRVAEGMGVPGAGVE